MARDRYSTSFEDPLSKQVTSVGVTVTREARRQIEKLVDDAEPMIRRCVWRCIGLNCEAGTVVGESVELTIDSEQILQLFSDLRQIDLEETRRKHRMQSGKD
jgi:hypothetical protein